MASKQNKITTHLSIIQKYIEYPIVSQLIKTIDSRLFRIKLSSIVKEVLMYKFLAYLVIFVIFFSGCTKCINHPITIISDPPGCNVEVEDNFVGKTPITTSVKLRAVTYGGGEWFAESPDFIHIKVYPPAFGGYVQTNTLLSNDLIKRDATTVYFDMRLEPSPERYEIKYK